MRTTLITEFSPGGSFLTSKNIDLDTRKTLLAKAIVDNPESFTCSKKGDSFTWTIKPEIKNKYLNGFIKKYCRDFLGKALEQEMHNYFIQLNEAEKKSVILMLRTFLKGRSPMAAENDLNIEQYNKEIDEAIARVEAGAFHTHQEVEKMAKEW